MTDNIKSLKEQYSLTVYRHYFPQWRNGKNIRCFAHTDQNPSLSIYQKDGEHRHYCHACKVSGDCLDLIGWFEGISEVEKQVERLKEIAGIRETEKKIVKTYDYTDANGKLIFQVLRYEPKDFKQRRPDPNNPGKWIYNLNGVFLIPYNLPQVVKSDYSFICEGEKDVESLKALGIVASCNPMGAGKWRPEYNGCFRGKKVYIIPDNDEPGRKHALQVARSLKGVAETIKIIELPGLKEKQDISDWLEAGGTKDKLAEIVKQTPEWTGNTLLTSLIKWNDIYTLNTDTEYLLEKLIPEGAITLFFGKGGVGKTSLALQIIHAIAEGKDFLGLKTKQASVVFVDMENPLGVLRDRIVHIGHSDNILIWHGSCEPPPPRLDREDFIRYFDLPKGLLVFDTLRASFLGDENSSQDVAVVVDRLKQLRDKGYTVLLLHHTPKGNDTIYKGSTAIIDLVDNALCLEPLRDDEQGDFDPEMVYKFGTKIKTRFEPFSIHLQFDPSVKGFKIAVDPVERTLANMHDLLSEKGRLNSNQFYELVRNELDIRGKKRVFDLFRKGEGRYWETEREGKALIYRSKSPDIYRETFGPIGQKNGPTPLDTNKEQPLENTIKSKSPDRVGTFGPIEQQNGPDKSKISETDGLIIDLTGVDFEVIGECDTGF